LSSAARSAPHRVLCNRAPALPGCSRDFAPYCSPPCFTFTSGWAEYRASHQADVCASARSNDSHDRIGVAWPPGDTGYRCRHLHRHRGTSPRRAGQAVRAGGDLCPSRAAFMFAASYEARPGRMFRIRRLPLPESGTLQPTNQRATLGRKTLES